MHDKRIFLFAGIWNLILVIPLFFGKHLLTEKLGIPAIEYPVFLDLLIMCAFLTGLLNIWISKSKSKEILAMRYATWVKFGYVLIFSYHLFMDTIPRDLQYMMIPVMIVELFFAVGSQMVLWETMRK
jgi:hypothetical protein